ncbi:hypothetical protein FSP39_007490 [Pinctada imbricata]|uniref:Uncharacterized protein n=1 Tax=Pinctada imbricata TaxID=66713 RepID=A0AA89BSM6_PINIB|nr:hypothetical protein FSP39_007490 [Pinctada imbricata]
MKSDDPDKTLVCDSDDGRVGDHEHSDQHCRLRSQMDSNGMMGALEGTRHLNEDPVDVNEDSKCRCLYTWMTKHFSCDECPLPWSHAVNLARAVMANREQLEEKALKEPFTMKKSQFDTIKLSEKVRQSLSLSTLPVPLPLTCPAQYLHRQLSKYVYDQDKDPMENIATFKQGKLKVLMVEGIIFRILRLNSTKSVEIYPGDGSVILSQGAKGLYYRHIVPSPDGSIEEKTYSIKSLPPKTPGSSYSVEKLVRRANRILNQAVQEDKTLTAGDIYCWKHKLAVVQPLSTYLLEECTVPGYGRFTAFSNGHVRILFEDRTSLDMDCDFSKRIECCLQHSEDGTHMPSCEHLIPSTMRVNTDSRLGFCKLLLTNGQYQIVDVRKPGLYRK